MDEELLSLLSPRKGHFKLESGHHGALWLDLELLCLRPERVRPFALRLAQRVARHEVDAVCGPLIEGAFVALLVADRLGVEFTYAEQVASPPTRGLYPVNYRVPAALRSKLRGKRVAIINDVINAGSAVRGTLADLRECDALPVVIGSLVVLGDSAARFAENGLVLEQLAQFPNDIWLPSECPLCLAQVPLEDGGS